MLGIAGLILQRCLADALGRVLNTVDGFGWAGLLGVCEVVRWLADAVAIRLMGVVRCLPAEIEEGRVEVTEELLDELKKP